MAIRAAILQSAYIPWKGYFDLIHDVDLFVFYDTVQYTKNDWRNRNKIKTPLGTTWLTVPVGIDLRRLICETEIANAHWQKKHWKSIQQYYSKAPHFPRYRKFFEWVYLERTWSHLSSLNQFLIEVISRDFLGIATEFRDSRQYDIQGSRVERLIQILKASGAGTYVSGPGGRNYLDEEAFRRQDITVLYKSYAGYPEYSQFYPPFDHFVSVLDLLFHAGPDSPSFIWGQRK